MSPPLVRWNDDRLDDLARTVRQLDDMRELMVRLEGNVGELHSDLTQLQKAFEAARKREETRLETQRKERRADRWALIGTVISAAAVIVTALAIFV